MRASCWSHRCCMACAVHSHSMLLLCRARPRCHAWDDSARPGALHAGRRCPNPSTPGNRRGSRAGPSAQGSRHTAAAVVRCAGSTLQQRLQQHLRASTDTVRRMFTLSPSSVTCKLAALHCEHDARGMFWDRPESQPVQIWGRGCWGGCCPGRCVERCSRRAAERLRTCRGSCCAPGSGQRAGHRPSAPHTLTPPGSTYHLSTWSNSHWGDLCRTSLIHLNHMSLVTAATTGVLQTLTPGGNSEKKSM